jgi:hypothetical protein
MLCGLTKITDILQRTHLSTAPLSNIGTLLLLLPLLVCYRQVSWTLGSSTRTG